MPKKTIDELRNNDLISHYEAACILANTTDTKSEEFHAALDKIGRALDAGSLTSEQAVDIAYRRGDIDRSLKMHYRKFFIPAFITKEDEKQTMLITRDFLEWADLKSEKRLHSSKEKSLLMMIGAFATLLGYKPDDRNTVGTIVTKLDGLGVSMDPKTVRKHLKAASEEFKGRKNNN